MSKVSGTLKKKQLEKKFNSLLLIGILIESTVSVLKLM